MKKRILTALLIILTFSVTAQQRETTAARDQRMQWWRDATFGMFIHWGLYAVPAGKYNGTDVEGIGEWIMHHANIPIPEYEQYAKQFNPTLFDAKQWVKIAKDAGMKYIVITSKHHDGFCMWDSKVSTYDVMDATPFKRDILRELTDACKDAGIKMCFYHSIMDWHHPDAKAKNYSHQQTENPDWNNYRENYLKPQLKELIVQYNPAVLWFDGEWIEEWTEEQGKDLYSFLMDLKPDLIINNRIGKGRKGMSGMNAYEDAAGDFGTPEQEILEGTSNYDWESCMTMNDTWGFKQNDHNWKSARDLIFNLADVAAKGGNYLLNVGPTAQGTIPDASIARLKEMGEWIAVNGEAIYATNPMKTYKEGNLRFTQSKDGKYIYAIAFDPGDTIHISTIPSSQVKQITLLGSKKKLTWKKEQDQIIVTLPKKKPSSYAVVLKTSL